MKQVYANSTERLFEMNMYQRLLQVGFAVVILIPATLIAASPERTKVTTAGSDDVFFLQELGAVIMQDEETIRVDYVAPTDNRTKVYRSVDIESGDIIAMLNGKRVKSVKDLKASYEEAEIGEEIKFGIKRDKRMMIVAFPKADPENAPQQQIMMVKMGEDGEGTVTAASGPETRVIKMEAGSAGNTALLELGLLLGEDEESLILTDILPHASRRLGGVDMAEGDIVKSLQGKSVTTLDMFADLYESIPVGDTVSLVFQREGMEISVSFPRPDAQKAIKIEREH
jgi:S1-C subfamily serine protease